MSSQQQPTINQQTTPLIAPIDTKPIVENGQSPTAIILAIAILIAILIGSLTGLVLVVVLLILRQSKPSR